MSQQIAGCDVGFVARTQGTADTGAEDGKRVGLPGLAAYFLRLGALGFGGPVALVGAMHRDLAGRRWWVREEEYTLALALAQIMPGPLAAQLAIAIGYLLHGAVGAMVAGVAFVLPSFLMVVALAAVYVTYGGLWWMQAVFFGVGAAVIAIIAIASYKMTRSILKRDPLLWTICAVVAAITVFFEAEMGVVFILAGLLTLFVRARPHLRANTSLPGLLPLSPLAVTMSAVGSAPDILWQLALFFAKAGAFVFGSGLAIVPFLQQGVVDQNGWLTEGQFRDAIAVAMITPGPVVITVAFIGYLVAGLPGAIAAAIGMFLPVYLLTVIPMPWFARHRDNAQLKAFVAGASAAAAGALAGAVFVLGRRTIVDAPAALITLASFVVLWRFKLPEPVLVVAAGLVGLALWSVR